MYEIIVVDQVQNPVFKRNLYHTPDNLLEIFGSGEYIPRGTNEGQISPLPKRPNQSSKSSPNIAPILSSNLAEVHNVDILC